MARLRWMCHGRLQKSDPTIVCWAACSTGVLSTASLDEVDPSVVERFFIRFDQGTTP